MHDICCFCRIFAARIRDSEQKDTIMKKEVLSSLKSSETDDWLDIRVVRPLAYYCALGFAKLDIHPNTVTILSMIIGAASCFFFAHGSCHYEGAAGLSYNILAILLLVWADIYDCTDGQLARMTGKTSRLGRILDGAAGFVWFVPIYIALTLRFYHYHSIEFGWFGIADTGQNAIIATAILFAFVLVSGFYSMSGQQRVADYYIQAHLFFLKGEKGSELDNSAKQQQIYDGTPDEGNRIWKMFLKSYIGYTKKQEERTPQFQRLLSVLRDKYGSANNMPADVREELHAESLKLMKYNGMLTFNFRTAFFILFVLIDLPSLYFIVFEVTLMEIFCRWIIHRHESFCKRVADRIAA